MKPILTLLLAGACALTLTLGSCSDKSDEYLSRPPEFSDLTVTNLNGSDEIRVGDRVVLTAVQGRYGKWLNRTTYSWDSDPALAGHSYKPGAIYDQEAQNPTDTVTLAYSGAQKFTFTGKYKISAGVDYSYNYTAEPTPGCRVKYSAVGIFDYIVTVEKTIKVLPRKDN